MKFGFQKGLSSEFPSQIVVDLTQFCNLACVHCPHPKFKKSIAYSGQHLDIDLHTKLIDEVSNSGTGLCKYIRYTANGETLLHPKFDQIIKYACIYSGTKINVTTNGSLLTNAKSVLLVDAGVDVVDVSIDAYRDETYSKIRINGTLDDVRKNVLNLIDLSFGSKTKVVVSYVEQELNSEETDLFEKFWNDAGADFVLIRKLHSAAGSKLNVKSDIVTSTRSIKRRPCLYPWERLVLTPEGDLSFCPAGWSKDPHFTSYRNTTIKEAWRSRFMEELRAAHLSVELEGFTFCEQCPDWVYTIWPNSDDFSYSDVMSNLVEK